MTSTRSKPYSELERLSTSTQRGHAQGLSIWNVFAREQGVPLLGEWNIEDLERDGGIDFQKTFAAFAHFLLVAKKADGNNYACDCQVQYLSNAKNAFVTRFRKVNDRLPEILKENSPMAEWYSELRIGLSSRSRANCIKRGEKISDKTLGIRHKLLLRIATVLAEEKTISSDEKRLVVLLLYHAVGRGGEVAFLNMSNMRFDEDDSGLWTGWAEPKTGHDSEIPYFPNNKEYLTDVIHALAVYIFGAISRGSLRSNPNKPSWLLPGYQKLTEGNAATKVSRILSELVKKGNVDGLTSKHTSHSLRAGPSDDLAMNAAVDIIAIILRGNWDFKGDCLLFGYLFKGSHVARAGKALAGWKPTQEVVTASLDAIKDDGARMRLDKMTDELFAFAPLEFKKNGHLAPLRNVLMAAVLKDLTAFLCLTSENSEFFKFFLLAAKKCDVQISELKDWGELIKKDFEHRNLSLANKSTSNTAECERVFRIMNSSLLDTQVEVAALRKDNLELRSKIDSMDRKIDSLLELLTSTSKNVDNLRQECVVAVPFTARKRGRISDESNDDSTKDTETSVAVTVSSTKNREGAGLQNQSAAQTSLLGRSSTREFVPPPALKLLTNDPGPAPVGGMKYLKLSLTNFLCIYRVHGIFSVEGSVGDHILGLHDTQLGFTGKEIKDFQRRKSRVKKLYSYAMAASIHNCESAYNLLFVRSKDNPTPLHNDADFVEWRENVEAAATHVATAVHEKNLKTKQSLGLKTKQNGIGVLTVGTASSDIEAINTAQRKSLVQAAA